MSVNRLAQKTDNLDYDKDQQQKEAKPEMKFKRSENNPFQTDYSLNNQQSQDSNQQSVDLGHNYNVGLTHFFSLPKLDKPQIEAVFRELRQDMEMGWTPSKLVEKLNKHIVSQDKAKKIIAQAVRNKYRMRQIEGEIRSAMRPSNILVHGRSGSGKTEIFRQISKIYDAPFIRVEATKYTEVGYYGEDITSIVTDLFKKTENEVINRDSVTLLKNSSTIKSLVDQHILKCILGPDFSEESDSHKQTLKDLEQGKMEEYQCFIYLPGQKKYTQQICAMKVNEIRKYSYEVYLEELFSSEAEIEQFIKDEIEGKGIVVIDEIDKLVRSADSKGSTKASDEGVQYDMLPLLDGTQVSVAKDKVKINTRNILFVGAGAFEKTKPNELTVELQGRLPIKAKMIPLTQEDFQRILQDTDYNLLNQSIELLKTEKLNIAYDYDAIEEIAKVAAELNEEDNIGARRLRTVIDAVLEDINYSAPDFELKDQTIVIGKDYVHEKTRALFLNTDYRKYTM